MIQFQQETHRIFINDENGKMIAEVTFPEREPGVFVINHTFVDECLRGQGIASQLVERAVKQIKEAGGTVEATCSYAVHWLEKNR